jgi:non-heme chloroperoxidase
MPTITTSDGVQLHHTDDGDGSPVVLLAGRDSQVWPCEHATATAALNPRATAVVLDECGHAVNIDQPEAANAAILEVLR